MPRIALIHATAIAVDPIRQELSSSWPDVDAVNILEDSLAPDRAKVADLTPELTSRIIALAQYARSIGSDAVLFTCSAFGAAIAQAARTVDIPVLKPNEAMFEAAIAAGGRVAMLYTFPPARIGMEEEFREQAANMKSPAVMDSFLVQHAIEAVRAGDAATHNRLVSEAAAKLDGYDAIVLAHFSTARALDDVRAATLVPVFSSPKAAVQKLRRLVA